MPRKARIFVPGCLHHIMVRGIDGMAIFCDDEDRSVFLRFLEKCLARSRMRCYAWALMPNHYHIVNRTGDRPLATLMKPLNSLYAGYYNKRYGRRGYLFQDRFKSIATQDQGYIEELVRYVHLNPVRGSICTTLDDLDKYPWTGHSALMGVIGRPFQDVGTVLLRFGPNDRAGRRGYRAFVSEGLSSEPGEKILAVRDNTQAGRAGAEPSRWVIGDPDFVQRALKSDRENRLRIAKHAVDGWNMERLAGATAKSLGIPVESLLRRRRAGAAAEGRKILAYTANREYDIPVAEIARFLRIDGSAASRMVAKGEVLAKKRGGC